ncbi:hypothetical protein D7Y22_05135 [Stenotrophomonas maltophilia]|uniref:hypothetical protein n=1 Tax=Stenotrophomonas maltophilia TaxID=40324 RepID=UPI0015DF2BF9|nr:hypothetical protein [Stenotrophomonas maltophilia]MBA0420350.1 hypothetical protein [Stenotrophomonas maltophilia]
MDAIEKRARKLYAEAFRAQGMELTAERLDDICTKIEGGSFRASLDAIKAALTLPEGYVLVPAEPTEEMIAAAEDAHMPFGDMGFAISAAIGARPEVP